MVGHSGYHPGMRIVLVTAVIVLLALPAPAEVKVEKAEPTVEYKEFDPKKPPVLDPPFKPGEAAACLYRFEVDADVAFATRPRRAVPGTKGEPPVDVVISGLTVRLKLAITIWLPTGATDRLKEHEEGHRRLAEAYYAKAEAIAKAQAAKVDGKKFVAAGLEKAKAEITAMNKTVCDGYLEAINRPCDVAQKVFDELTDHGVKKSPTTDEGVKLALEAAEKSEKK